MKKNIKLFSLIMNVIAVVVTSAILIGSSVAWFTDSATSFGNKIQAGTLKVDLEFLDKEDGWLSLKDENSALFDYENWEPGYTDVKILKIQNEGSLALQWKAKFVSQDQLSDLANVIDVYVLPSQTELDYPADRNLEGYSHVGTVADFVNTIETTTKGVLLANEEAYLGIALKMQTTAGNEYQGVDLGGVFDIIIVATQLSAESDVFDDDYDADATLDWTPVANPTQLRLALANKESTIILTNDIVVDGSFLVSNDLKIDGNGYSIVRSSASPSLSNPTTPFTDNVFVVQNANLELTNVVVDGGAIWSGEVDAVLGRGTENVGVVSTGALISASPNANIILGEGAVIQNNVGSFAINLGTRAGSTLTLNGGEVINNSSGAGAIWGGGHITVNSGKISYNNSTSTGEVGAGAIRMVGDCNLTMNGGEINNNKALTNGGAIWGYGSSKYFFNGGEMSNNCSSVGGAMWPGNYSVINISGDFKMNDNSADKHGAIRITDHTSLTMTGGEICDNGDNSLFVLNNDVSITGGKINNNFTHNGGLCLVIGAADITGVITYNSDNFNTPYLDVEFNSFKFFVKESNLNSFRFNTASGYVYTDGDENKLLCQNEGYVTYYDSATNTFRLRQAS